MPPSQQVDDGPQLPHQELPAVEGRKIVSVSHFPLAESLTASQAVGTAGITTAKHTEGQHDVPQHTTAPDLQKIQDNLKARNPGWSQEKVQMTASDQLVQALAKQRGNADNGAVRLSSADKAYSMGAQQIHRQQSQAAAQGSDDAGRLSPSRSVSPSGPLGSMGTSTSTSIATSSAAASASGLALANAKQPPRSPLKTPPPAPRRHYNTVVKDNKPARRERRKFKSSELVVDSDEADSEMKASDFSAPPEAGVVDPSEGLAGFEHLDENGSYKNKPHARLLLEKGRPRPALVVKLKVSPEKLNDALYGKKSNAEQSNRELGPAMSARNRQSRIGNTFHAADASRTRDSLNKSLPDIVGDDEDAAWSSRPETAAIIAPLLPLRVDFPRFPTLTATHLPPFMKGLTIAIENIIADHTDKLDDTLLELVKQLEEDKPTLPGGTLGGDERHTVMSGGQYVYTAVRQVCVDVVVPGKDLPKDLGVDADGDINMTDNSSDHVGKIDNVKLTDHYGGITALPEKAKYKGKGRAWKKTPGDADPAFRTLSKVDVSKLPERDLSRRKATRGDQLRVWKEQQIEELLKVFCAHVRREYWFHAGKMGVKPDKEVLPSWLWER